MPVINANSVDCPPSNDNEHIIVDVIITSRDNHQFKTFALIDSGSMENFCDESFATRNKLPLVSKAAPVEIITVDGSPISSGKVTQETSIQMTMGLHTEKIKLSVTRLGQYPIILGIPWLKKHDPKIIWSTHSITFDSASCVHSCFQKVHQIKALPTHPNYSKSTTINLSLFDQSPAIPQGNNIDCINKIESFDAYSDPPTTKVDSPNVDIKFVSYASIKKDLTDENSCYINPSEVIRIADYPLTHYIASALSTSDSELTATKEDYSNVPEKYSEFYEVFSKKKANTLPPHRPYDHQIILQEGKKPPFGPIYSLSQVELDELAKYLKENLANGFISRSTSPAAAPILFVKKKSGELRLCIDNRGLNAVTVRDPPVLPLVSEMIDRLGNALYYTKLDVRNAYYRIRIKSGHEWLTGFRCKYGHFQYNVLNFGLVNAPSTWMAYLNDVLREHIDQTAIFFYDDILVYTNGDLNQHTKDVKAILKKLLDAELYIKAEKCEFDKTEVDFLGIRIGRNGVSMDTEKIKAIMEWPTPKSQHDIQVFLGFANYHRAFLKNYSKYTTPLTNLLQKGVNFRWREKEEKAFNALKTLFTSKPVLKIFSPDKPCIMETDASDFAIGSVLSQYDDNNVLHPIAYFSRKLKSSEINYEIYDKEMLAIVDSFIHWRHYLQDPPHKTLVLTDHRNLEYFLDAKKLNRRQARYAIKLSDYNFVIQYRSATQNQRADALSRRPDFQPDEHEKQPIQSLFKPEQFCLSSATSISNCDITMDPKLQERLISCQKQDPIYKIVSEPNKFSHNIVSRHENYLIDKSTGLLLKNHLIYVPNNNDIKLYLLRIHHDSITAGHFGRAKTAELLSRNYWWKGMTKFVNRYIANCQTCIRGKPSRQSPQGPLMSLQIPTNPWESISMDFIVKLPKSKGFDSIFVVVDRLTKMAHFIPCNESMTAKELATLFINNIFRLHGLPSSIVSDRGTLFTSKFWKHLLNNLDIKANMSTAYRPETDGQTERTNSTLEQYLRMYCNYQQNNWCQLLSTAEFSYNNHCQASTQFSPFFANYGYHPKTSINIKRGGSECVPASEEFLAQLKLTQEQSKVNITKAQASQAAYYDQRKRKIEKLNVGDQVYINSKNIITARPMKKLDHKRLGPFKIVEKISSHAYKLDLPTSMKIHPTFHISRLTPRTIKGLEDIENRELPPPPPIVVNSNEEYEVDQILDSRMYRGKLQYKVKWKGYEDPSEDTWEDQENLENAQLATKQFHQDYPHKPSPTSNKTRSRS
ncbi:hypothetical protein G6F42_012533 [Rhizopus arrhizus]|nr:hypothetical protein G6F42_012533 [Rhizopus arrhizus]